MKGLHFVLIISLERFLSHIFTSGRLNSGSFEAFPSTLEISTANQLDSFL
jgi:hypothetical protein